MPRPMREESGGLYCHVLNRGNGRAEVFHDEADYAGFVELLALACHRIPMRVAATVVFAIVQYAVLLRERPIPVLVTEM